MKLRNENFSTVFLCEINIGGIFCNSKETEVTLAIFFIALSLISSAILFFKKWENGKNNPT